MRKVVGGIALSVILAVAVLFVVETKEKEPNRHQVYGEFLKNHPFMNRPYQSPEEWKKLPKADRPDLAFEQNFIMTMDPTLGRPAPERLQAAQMRIAASQQRYKSGDASNIPALQWEERGPLEVAGRVRAIMFDPNDPLDRKVWAGGVSGGLWFNNNILSGASAWQPVDDFWRTLSVTCMDFDPTNPQTFYVGTGEGPGSATVGEGIWKTTDGGLSWSQLSASTNMTHINDLVVRNENGVGVLYVGVRNRSYQGVMHGNSTEGLYRSVDGGNTFSQVLPNVPGANHNYAVGDLEIGADNRLWVGTTNSANSNNPGGGDILYSDDGQNFSTAHNTAGHRVELGVAPSNKDYVYALIERSGVVWRVLRSTDQGQTWEQLTEPSDDDPGIPSTDFSRNQAWYDLIAQVDPNDETVVTVGGINLFRSTDTGNTWQQMTHWYGGFGHPFVHADQHQFIYRPGSSNTILSGNDGGIAISSNYNFNSPSFSDRNRSFNVTQFYSCALHPDAGSNYFLGGTQDNGTIQFTRPGFGSTNRATGGDGGFCFIDQDNPNFQITSYVYNTFWRSFNGGSNFGQRFINDLGSGRFINPADYDDNLNVLYSAESTLFIKRVNNADGNFTESSIRVRGMFDMASHLRVSPYTTSSTTLFVGSGAGKVLRIDSANVDGAEVVTDITGPSFPAGYVSCIEIGASEDELLVSYSNYGVSSLWYTDDGGTTWVEKEGDLPDMPVRWALFNPRDRDMVILATELGVWETRNFSDASPTWQPANQGLANVRTDMLQLRESDYTVLAATYGRGMYTANFESGIGIEEAAAGTIPTLSFYPNPAKEQLKIDLREWPRGNYKLQLLDLNGKLIRQQSLHNSRVEVVDWDLSQIASGSYILQLRGKEFQTSEKLIIQ